MARTLSIPYGSPAASPFWGPQTSAVNFCEEDYIITAYIGEFVNCLTSLSYIGYGVLGISRSRNVHVSPFGVVNLPYWGLIGIGIFSGLYHCTMKYHTQMSDELAMHLAMGCTLIRLFTFQQPLEIQRRNATIIVVGLTSFVIYHCVTDEFTLHVILFFMMSVLVGWKTYRVINEGTASESQKKKLTSLIKFASGNALFAYFLWNIDVHLCSTLTAWKRSIGIPWGFILELHGWWHILTAVSCYIFTAVIELLTTPEEERGSVLGFLWPVKGVFRELVSENGAVTAAPKSSKADGFANGSVKVRSE